MRRNGMAAILGLLVAMAGRAASAEQVTVVIENYAFSPAELTVPVGTRITWINRDDSVHTVTAVDGAFHSSAMDNEDGFSAELTVAGDFEYICKLHPQMRGVIHVH